MPVVWSLFFVVCHEKIATRLKATLRYDLRLQCVCVFVAPAAALSQPGLPRAEHQGVRLHEVFSKKVPLTVLRVFTVSAHGCQRCDIRRRQVTKCVVNALRQLYQLQSLSTFESAYSLWALTAQTNSRAQPSYRDSLVQIRVCRYQSHT